MKLFFILIFIGLSVHSMGQISNRRHFNLKERTKNISFYSLIDQDDPEVSTQLIYYWFDGNTIQTNQGGYSGHLLDGNYECTDSQGELLQKGQFSEGLKTGEWKCWDKNGKLCSLYNWDHGLRKGFFEERDSSTGLVKKGNYKNGKLNGLVKTYQNDSLISQLKYKNGQAKTPKSLWKHLEEKLKRKDTNSTEQKSAAKKKRSPVKQQTEIKK